MNAHRTLPLILVIDDLFGRTHVDRRNEERANLCGQYLLQDVTGDEADKDNPLRIKEPIARAVFFRGQRPLTSAIGDNVENDLEGTIDFIRRGWSQDAGGGQPWSLVLLDLCFYTGRVTEKSSRERGLGMPQGRSEDAQPAYYFGLKVLDAVHRELPDLPVVILSSMSREDVSREFAAKGALGFLPREQEESRELLRDYIWRHGLIQDESGEVVGKSKTLLLALRTARRAVVARRNVLIRGERGAGKELFAQYIHRQSGERKRPFVTVNSAVLSPTLFASELFGIKARVATGVEERKGLIVKADHGDLFFDEINDMSAEAQAGVLRVLEDGEVVPVGATASVSVDVRFLSATNIDIETRAASGVFRPDLLDRLREGGTIVLPPLRDRREDIPELVTSFVWQAEDTLPSALRRQVTPEALDLLIAHAWPGNVRELRNTIFTAVLENPDVEYLVPRHIRLQRSVTLAPASTSASLAESAPVEQLSLEQLLSLISSYRFDGAAASTLAGRLPELERACAKLLAAYVKAAVSVTRRPTATKPEGNILIHPAAKLMSGDPTISASKAADIIKRLLRLHLPTTEELLIDPVLKDAYETAIRLRPSDSKTKRRVPT